MSDIGFHDPLHLGTGGLPVKVKRGDWELIQEIMGATSNIPHDAENPLSSKTSVAWKAMDKVINLWIRANPEDAELFFSRYAANAKLEGTGLTKDRTMRMKLSVPASLIAIIRAVFKGQEFSGVEGTKFWNEFSRRYPALRATENV